MKFTDTNGIEIECSPGEYLELQAAGSKKEKKIKIDVIKKKRGRKERINWKKRINEVKNFLNEKNKSFSINEINEVLGYSKGSSSTFLRSKLMKDKNIQTISRKNKVRLKFASLEYKKRRKIIIPESKPELIPIKPFEDKRIKRCRFINERCKSLQINDIRMSRERALSIASDEWKAKGKIIKVPTLSKEDTFPALYGLTAKSEPLAISRISECISHNRKIGYFDLKEVCQWESGLTWIHFINSFLKNKKEIADYFSVIDKFSQKRINGYDYILYGY